MMPMRLSWIAAQLDWQLLGSDRTIEGITTDSRQVKSGDCFLALCGERFDAHEFIPDVVARGAGALIVSTAQELAEAQGVPQLVVKDTRLALGQLGALVRQQVAPKVIAITGSCGKTTVKEMIAAILANRGNVLATAGNFNNDIGVPLTLLRLEPQHEFAVMELGANHQGEIAYTTAMAKPDVALITNIGAAHLEGFGDIDDVANAKGEIFSGLSNGGTAIYDLASEYADRWQNLCQGRMLCGFSLTDEAGEAPVSASQISLDKQSCAAFELHTPLGQVAIRLGIPGRHNVANVLAAAAACLAVGITLDEIKTGLANMVPVGGRLNVTTPAPGFTLIDDTYNANVTSVTAAINLLAQRSGLRVLVLGDMGELGEDARHYHREMGRLAAEAGLELLVTQGQLSSACGDLFTGEYHHFEDQEVLSHFLVERLAADATDVPLTILVKGSRSAKMERVVAMLSTSQLASIEYRSSFEC